MICRDFVAIVDVYQIKNVVACCSIYIFVKFFLPEVCFIKNDAICKSIYGTEKIDVAMDYSTD